ncbi:hypothetical protein KQI61_05685 [Anaerocolumna aminovalerica]|uniref:hypothetical protein n=1 Tax=Anaerocolumna aminovalerica TaxID=1527 RepID=UPI001C0EF048|nr:hypothetical protein [Anaerocolumna aminovalerica]MBU5331681.1 hypothetical protein [Anaerocolumna aminovalerica]
MYIINNENCTDFELGKIYSTPNENGFDITDDVHVIAEEIVFELYKSYKGKFKFLIDANFTFHKDYSYDYGCYEYDMDYEYEILNI